MEFKEAVNIVLLFEGGYVNDPKDPGGETNFGISKRSYPKVNMKTLTKAQAKEIYKRDYWDAMRCDELPTDLRLLVFDCAVNQGVSRATRFLQSCIETKVDGYFGPETLALVCEKDSDKILKKYANKRLEAYQGNRNFLLYGKGWTRRLLHVTLLTRK